MSKARLNAVLKANKVSAVANKKNVNGEEKITYQFKPVGPVAKAYWSNH